MKNTAQICASCGHAMFNRRGSRCVPCQGKNESPAARIKRWTMQGMLITTAIAAALEKKIKHGICGCCGRGNLRLSPDHHHPSGIVRDVVCMRCNALVGCLESGIAIKDPTRKALVVAYVTRFPETFPQGILIRTSVGFKPDTHRPTRHRRSNRPAVQ